MSKENSVTISVMFNGVLFKQMVILPENSKDIFGAITECSNIIVGQIEYSLEDPDGKRHKAIQAVIEQWMDNVDKGVGDATGETIPSTKQVIDRLKSEQ